MPRGWRRYIDLVLRFFFFELLLELLDLFNINKVGFASLVWCWSVWVRAKEMKHLVHRAKCFSAISCPESRNHSWQYNTLVLVSTFFNFFEEIVDQARLCIDFTVRFTAVDHD